MALLGSLLLLAASFALLVLAPVLLGRFQSASQAVPAGGFLPIAAASGIALGGGAAMIAVVARLVRDIELRPYAGLAPVLAVFAGFVLWGLRAKLPLDGVPSEYAGVFALIVSVAGGALVAQRGAFSRLVGWALAFFAPVTLMLLVWGGSGKSELSAALASLTPQLKMFLGLSAGSALAMVVLGEASRVLARSVRVEMAPKTTQSFAAVGPGAEPLFPAPSLRRSAPAASSQSYDAVLPAPQYGARAPEAPLRYDYAAESQQPGEQELYVPDATPAPHVNVWDLEDDELQLPKRFAWWKVLFLSLLVLGAAGAAVYYGMVLPNRAKEQAAAQIIEQKRAQIEAEARAEVEAKRAAESRADAARLEAMLAAPSSVAAVQGEGQLEAAAVEPAAPIAVPVAPTVEPAAPTVEPAAAKTAVSVEQLKAPARRATRNKPERSSEQPARPAARAKGDSNSDDPIYGL